MEMGAEDIFCEMTAAGLKKLVAGRTFDTPEERAVYLQGLWDRIMELAE